MTRIDSLYYIILAEIHQVGDQVFTRNGWVKSCFDFDPLVITETPLVTLRKTAWKKALREMEWFMSGEEHCPEELRDWWRGQLDPYGDYVEGYSTQFRYCGSEEFDQIQYILDGLRYNPNSRRLVMTTWNPHSMATITELNRNSDTPTCCHGTLVQYVVRDNVLHGYHYQRSADVLLGLPHNLIQYWALMLYFAHHADLQVGSLRYQLGDAHLYQHPSHIETVEGLLAIELDSPIDNGPQLCYTPVATDGAVPPFRAIDFSLQGEIPPPRVCTKPVLL